MVEVILSVTPGVVNKYCITHHPASMVLFFEMDFYMSLLFSLSFQDESYMLSYNHVLLQQVMDDDKSPRRLDNISVYFL